MTVSGASLPYARQSVDAEDISAVAEALLGDFLTTGPLVEAYEKDFAVATGAEHAVVCNSGTAALHLAMLVCDCSRDDAVIVPSMTFLATANAVRMTGAEVIFADVDPLSGLMTPQTFADALRKAGDRRVKATIAVHLNGHSCSMTELSNLAVPRNISVVEDACHALGMAGAGATRHSTAACFSTHPVKAIATGEGGAVTTSDATMAERMRRLRSHGMVREASMFKRQSAAANAGIDPWYYEMHEIGWNYRLPDILCALGRSQLHKLERFHARRAEIAALYDLLLAPLAPLVEPVRRLYRASGWHLYAVLVDFSDLKMTRSRLMAELKRQGIGTQVHYFPVHRQPYYVERYGPADLAGADAYYEKCLSIPLFPSMSDDDVHRVANALSQLVRGG